MSKVKPKAVGRDQGAELFDMWPEQIAQGRMDQMCRRMISRGVLSGRPIHRQMQLFAFADTPLTHPTFVYDHRLHRPSRLLDLQTPLWSDQDTLIPDLTAAFCIKRRDVENHLDLIAFLRLLDETVALEYRLQNTVGIQLVVADKLCRAETGRQFGNGRPRSFLLEAAGLACSVPLLFDGRVKPCLIDRHALFPARFGNQVHREAVCVVELEHIGTREDHPSCVTRLR